MENWSHFGINNAMVIKQYNYVMKLKFPEIPEEDGLYDLFSELVEIDGYIMGLITNYLKTGIIDISKLDCDSEFIKLYTKVKGKYSELDEIIHYKYELDKLTDLFIKNKFKGPYSKKKDI